MRGSKTIKLESLAAIFLFAITFIIYHKSLFGSFIFDDVIVILREPLLKKGDFFDFLKELPLKERPIRLLTFYLDRLVWELNPFGFRFTNLIIHMLNGILLFFILLKLGLKKEVAFFSSAIFLSHFVNPATVCYITGRKDLLGFLFSLFAFFFALNYKENRAKKEIFLFALFFFLALFTKEMYITLPFIVFAYLFIVLEKKIPLKLLLVSMLTAVAFTVYVIIFREVSLGNLYKRFSIPEYFIGYLRLFFDPTFPKIDYVGYFNEAYSFNGINWLVFVTSFIILLGYLYLAFLLRKKDRFLSFLLISFIISLLPVLQIIQHSESFAEHYFYFPSVFLSIFLSQIILGSKRKKVVLSLFILIIILLSIYTYKRTKIFMSEENFWQEAYRRNPKSFRAIQYQGQKLLAEGKVEDALRLFEEGYEKTVKLYNYNELAYTYYYDFLNNLALVEIIRDNLKKAESYYLKGLETLPESDKKQLFLFNLSVLYLKQDRVKAKDFMRNIVLNYQQYQEVGYLLYDIYWQDGQMKELEKLVDELFKRNRENYFALSKKILLLMKKGKKEEAMGYYSQLKKLSPRNYYELNDAAEIEIFLGNYKRARDYLLMALEEKPEYGRTKKNLKRLQEISN